MVRDLDAHYFRRQYPFYNTFLMMQTQDSKDFSRSKKPKSKNPKSAPPHDVMPELAKKEGEKKKRSQKNGRKCTWKQKKQSSATGVNIKDLKKKIKAKCFNRNKKATILTTVPSQKTRLSLGNLRVSD